MLKVGWGRGKQVIKLYTQPYLKVSHEKTWKEKILGRQTTQKNVELWGDSVFLLSALLNFQIFSTKEILFFF